MSGRLGGVEGVETPNGTVLFAFERGCDYVRAVVVECVYRGQHGMKGLIVKDAYGKTFFVKRKYLYRSEPEALAEPMKFRKEYSRYSIGGR
jgi:hypothetical protein